MTEAHGVKFKELDVSLNAQLEDACAEFEAAWRRAVAGGPVPSVDRFVDEAPDAIREVVRAQLGQIEARFRPHAGPVNQGQSSAATEFDCQLGDTATHTPIPSEAGNSGKTEILNGSMPRTSATAVDRTLELPPRPAPDSGITIEQTIGLQATSNAEASPTPGAPADAGPAGTILIQNAIQGDDPTDFSLVGTKRDSSLDDFGDYSLAGVPTTALPGDWPNVAGYQILGELGRGGMGVVYKARQRGLRRLVALKMVLSGAHAGPQHLARFQTEAEAVARLQHPNIVQIYDVGEQTGLPYFSLEFVDGNPLDKQIAGKPQAPREAAQLIESLARAMHFAHEQGIIHRDLKPANILMTKDGVPKISDFGLAKQLEEVESSQTQSGTIMGTPSYMSPEQARGEVRGVGPLADQYSLGAILYELLVGRPPFVGATTVDTVMQVTKNEPIPPTRLQLDIPPDLETICLKCLQKEPGKRYANCFELAEDLHRFLAGEPILARPIGLSERLWRWCKRNPKLAVSSAAILVLLLSGCVGSTWAALTIASERNQKETERAIAIGASELAAENEAVANEQAKLAVETLGLLIDKVQQQLKNTPGVQDLRKDLLETALAGLDRVANKSGTESKMQRIMADAYLKMGIVLTEFNRSKEAGNYFERCYALTKEELAKQPDNDLLKERLALACTFLGELKLKAPRDVQKTFEYYEQAFALREDIARRPEAQRQGFNSRLRPEERLRAATIKTNLSEGYTRVGLLHYFQQDSATAEPYILKSLALREQLARELAVRYAAFTLGACSFGSIDPVGQMLVLSSSIEMPGQYQGAWEMLQHTARNYHLIGEIYFRLKNFEKSKTFYEKCRLIREAASAADPNDYKLKGDMGQFFDYYGKVDLGLGDPKDALKQFDRSIALMREVESLDNKNVEYKVNLALSLYDRGQAALRVGDRAGAKKYFAECLEIREKLSVADPGNGAMRMDLMLVLPHCGQVERGARIAEELKQGPPKKDRGVLFNIARCYAQCMAASSGLARERFQEQSLNSLKESLAAGLKDSTSLEVEPDLDPLRGLAQFKAIVDRLKSTPVANAN
jgi:eukaryotic-like serine/threonine-protein kinase